MAPIGVIRSALPAQTAQYKALAGWVTRTAPRQHASLTSAPAMAMTSTRPGYEALPAASLVPIRARLGNESWEQRLANSPTVIKLGRKWTHTAADLRGCGSGPLCRRCRPDRVNMRRDRRVGPGHWLLAIIGAAPVAARAFVGGWPVAHPCSLAGPDGHPVEVRPTHPHEEPP